MTTFLRRSGEALSLDGDWGFTLLDRPGGTVRTQTTVAVPGCWTMQDVGDIPRYSNVQMPFVTAPPAVPEDNPTGIYQREVSVPEAWAGRRIVLSVGGAETFLHVEVNGQAVGFGADSRLTQEFDLSDLVAAGETFTLTLTVIRWAAATYLEDQDHWHHAGLHRSVFLYSTPRVHLADLQTVADWDPNTGEAFLAVRVLVGDARLEGAQARVLLDGTMVGESELTWRPEDPIVAAYLYDGSAALIEASVGARAAWSAETPVLHDLVVQLVDADGTVVDELGHKVGFRRVEVVGDQLLVNGRAVLIKGSTATTTIRGGGKAVTRESIRQDLELMKAHNLNAVRTSHYPSDPYLYEVCDEIGLYVVDEANLETHAHMRSLTKDPVWAPAILDRITRMANRDKNHPSIIIWSIGNEAGASPVLDAAATWLRSYDPTRPVQYESAHFDLAMTKGLTGPQSWEQRLVCTDLLVPMYPSIEDLQVWATQCDHVGPLIMCEFEHAMNNSCGDLDRYWETVRTHRGLQGGFIWDWVDQALMRRLPDGTEALAYGGDFGDEPNDGPFCLNGLVSADRVPHPSLLEAKTVFQPVSFQHLGAGRVRMTNDHDFLNLADTQAVTWRVSIDGDELTRGDLGLLDLAPGASTVVDLAVPPLRLVGWQVAHLDVAVGDLSQWQTELGRSQTRTGQGANPADVTAPPTQLALWRAPVDNEIFGPGHAARWEQESLANAHESLQMTTEVRGDLITHEVTVPAAHDNPARVGVRIEVPSTAVMVEWIGDGPHENYPDRRASARVGRWLTAVEDWAVPYVHPQASGNRSGVRSLRFLDANGGEVCRFEEMDDLFVTISRHSDEQVAAAAHLEDLPASERVYLWIDAAHRGVGSGACGPDVDQRFCIPVGAYRWSYRYRPGVSTG